MPRAKARYDITAEDKTMRAINGVKRNFKSLRASVNASGKAIAGIGSVATVALRAVVRSSLAANDALAKTSSKLGIAQNELQGLRLAASQTAGVTGKTLDLALQRMTRRVAEAAKGTGEAKNAIAELGLDAQKLAAQSPDQTFRDVANAMEGVGGQGDKLRLAFKLFDSEGAALVNTLNAGVPALNAYREEAEALGIALNRVETAKIEAANDAMEKIGLAGQGAANKLTIALAPILEEVADRITNLVKEQDNFSGAIETGLTAGVRVVGVFADAWRGIQVVVKAAELAFVAVKAVVISMVSEFARLQTSIIQGLLTPIKGALSAMSGFSETATAALEKINDFKIGIFEPDALSNAAADIERVKGELKALALETIPSEALKRQLNDILDNAQARAEAIAARANAANDPVRRSFAGGEDLTKSFKELDKLREKDLKATEKANSDKERSFSSTLSNITSITDRESKKQSAIHKAAAIAQAVIDGIAAVQVALKSTGNALVNIALAATVGALSATNISKIAGARAKGGFVSGGSDYLVGEKGPEIFRPNGAGTIIPNSALGSDGSANQPVYISFEVKSNDARSFRQSMAENKQVIVGAVREAMAISGGRPGF